MGQDIKAVRQRLGETQARFARRFGVSQSTLHRWEMYGVPERGTAGYLVTSILEKLEKRELRGRFAGMFEKTTEKENK